MYYIVCVLFSINVLVLLCHCITVFSSNSLEEEVFSFEMLALGIFAIDYTAAA